MLPKKSYSVELPICGNIYWYTHTCNEHGEAADHGRADEQRPPPDFVDRDGRDEGEHHPAHAQQNGARERVQLHARILEEVHGVHENDHGASKLTEDEDGRDEEDGAPVARVL